MSSLDKLNKLYANCIHYTDKELVAELSEITDIDSEGELIKSTKKRIIKKIITRKIAMNYIRFGDAFFNTFDQIIPVGEMLTGDFYNSINEEIKIVYNELIRIKPQGIDIKINDKINKKEKIPEGKLSKKEILFTPEEALYYRLDERLKNLNFENYRKLVLKCISETIANRYNIDNVLDFYVSEEMSKMSEGELAFVLDEIDKTCMDGIDEDTRNRIAAIIRSGGLDITEEVARFMAKLAILTTTEQKKFLTSMEKALDERIHKLVQKGKGKE